MKQTPETEHLKKYLPETDETICLVSYVIARTRMGGSPEDRKGFWPAYREALETNRRTRYNNSRIAICGPIFQQLQKQGVDIMGEDFFYRSGKLVQEKDAQVIRELPLSSLTNRE